MEFSSRRRLQLCSLKLFDVAQNDLVGRLDLECFSVVKVGLLVITLEKESIHRLIKIVRNGISPLCPIRCTFSGTLKIYVATLSVALLL